MQHHVLPEMNHNELVGWKRPNNDLAVILLRNDNDYQRTRSRMEISKEIRYAYTNNVTELYSKGINSIERTIFLIHVTDRVSLFLATRNNVDVTEVAVIDHLKSKLAKM